MTCCCLRLQSCLCTFVQTSSCNGEHRLVKVTVWTMCPVLSHQECSTLQRTLSFSQHQTTRTSLGATQLKVHQTTWTSLGVTQLNISKSHGMRDKTCTKSLTCVMVVYKGACLLGPPAQQARCLAIAIPQSVILRPPVQPVTRDPQDFRYRLTWPSVVWCIGSGCQN